MHSFINHRFLMIWKGIDYFIMLTLYASTCHKYLTGDFFHIAACPWLIKTLGILLVIPSIIDDITREILIFNLSLPHLGEPPYLVGSCSSLFKLNLYLSFIVFSLFFSKCTQTQTYAHMHTQMGETDR